ncbi:hypothetical protein ABPG74_019420 [Tetrahymena malaccensis]
MNQDVLQNFVHSSSKQSRRGQYEGAKQESAQYSLSSLNYPNNIVQRSGSNNQRHIDEFINSHAQNVKQSFHSGLNAHSQNKVFTDSHDEQAASNFQNHHISQISNQIMENQLNANLSRNLQSNQNYLNVDPSSFIPTTHMPPNQKVSAPANPNYLNNFVSLNPNLQTFNGMSTQQQQQYNLNQQYQSCPSHPKYDITNICVAETCIEPLCPECVKIHTYMHNQKDTPTNIDTILCKREQCIEYVRELRENFFKEQAVLNKIGDIEKGDIFQQCLDQIQKARDLVFQNLNSYFNSFELRVKQRINEIRQNHPHLFGSIHSKIQAMVREVSDMEAKLESSQYVKYIIQILSDDFNIDFERIQQDVDYGIEHYLSQLFKVQVDTSILSELDDLMQKYISTDKVDLSDYQWRDGQQQVTHEVLHSNLFVKKQNQNDNHKDKENNMQDLFESNQKKLVPQPIDYNTVSFPTQQTQQANANQSDVYDLNDMPYENKNTKNQQSKSRPKSEYINPYQQANNAQQVQNVNVGSQGLDGDQSPLNGSYASQRENDRGANINIYDYFNPDCLLNIVHFFQDNSKLFHFLDLSQLSRDPATQEWQTVELNIAFKIPMFHRSIITPNGKVFLVGGIDVLHKNKSINSTYFLDMNRNTLELCSNMNYERNSHSLVVAQDSIFVVGGLNNNDEDIYLQSCERFDIESQKWIQIADLQEGVSGTSLCNFHDKYIFRYGGKTYLNNMTNTIERYNIQEDFWEYIPFQFTEAIPSFAGSVQINDNEMLILGGQIGEINQKQAIIARVDESNPDALVFYKSKSMPSSGTFWQNPIIGGNVVFAVQNIKMENCQMNYFSKKSLFVFNCRAWKELGIK